MATFITLLTYTHQGIKNIKESPDRLDAAKEVFKSMGADLKAFYLLQGQYDALIISEAPDCKTAAKIALAIGALGNVRTETIRAYSEIEYRDIIAALP